MLREIIPRSLISRDFRYTRLYLTVSSFRGNFGPSRACNLRECAASDDKLLGTAFSLETRSSVGGIYLASDSSINKFAPGPRFRRCARL